MSQNSPISQAKKNIPVFILAGGMGTRLSEETDLKPKPMLEIGQIPVLLHLMRWYYSFGFDDFVICAGYRAWDISSYFLDYEFRRNNLVIDHRKSFHTPPGSVGQNADQEKWRVRVIDTGLHCMTGGRIARAFDIIEQEQNFSDFALTYGDGLSDVNLSEELKFHRTHGKLGTVLGVRPTARFGEMDCGPEGKVLSFLEKPESKQGIINGGFFFFKKEFRKYLKTESECILEKEPLTRLAQDDALRMHSHRGFWYPMDTQRDKIFLQGLWDSGKAPWAVSSSSVRTQLKAL